ncbi:hypothetical protein QJS04_geneDACA019507 [Acorus gramineus]|uniref:Nijmegen breakage syndrome 1 protein n=1 Tax=Acorus gramineus TaxID=55184 RepID=A0AAV9ABR1_ACOGR|nr:hypothetical protein QJS04_geneDACA019507 [Acorus gramineus]
MVWALFPVEIQPGAQNYYIFAKGTYKVGRKDCDVIIQTDRGVSRLHAEIVVDRMTSQDPSLDASASFPSDVRIRDLSKFGTFINKKTKAVLSGPNKEETLTNGDLVSFGTGNAIFRFCFVPLIFFIHCLKTFPGNSSLHKTIASIGACATENWRPECTHVLADESSLVTDDVINAIVAQRPVIRSDWVEVLADKNFDSEIPSCSSYAPILKLEGKPVKIVEPRAREKCLERYTFVLGLSQSYIFGDGIQALLEVAGAKVLAPDEISSDNQTLTDGTDKTFVLVIPTRSVDYYKCFNHLNLLSRVQDTELIAAVLSGHMEQTIIKSPPIVVSSSYSTDGTIVADSDVEVDTPISVHNVVTVKTESSIVEEQKIISSFKTEHGVIQRRDKDRDSEALEHQNPDIIYSQDLIVRSTDLPTPIASTLNNGVVNFKCFKKRETVSGNSFRNLILFSKDPYKENDADSEEVSRYVREEKKRKKMEAIAEDLFNNEQ